MNNIVRDIFLNRTGEDIIVIRKRKQEPLMSGSQEQVVEVCILGVKLLTLMGDFAPFSDISQGGRLWVVMVGRRCTATWRSSSL